MTLERLQLAPIEKKLVKAEYFFNVGNEEQKGRILGGEEAPPHSAPFQVALSRSQSGEKQFCSGSLISLRYVLTGEFIYCIRE